MKVAFQEDRQRLEYRPAAGIGRHVVIAFRGLKVQMVLVGALECRGETSTLRGGDHGIVGPMNQEQRRPDQVHD